MLVPNLGASSRCHRVLGRTRCPAFLFVRPPQGALTRFSKRNCRSGKGNGQLNGKGIHCQVESEGSAG